MERKFYDHGWNSFVAGEKLQHPATIDYIDGYNDAMEIKADYVCPEMEDKLSERKITLHPTIPGIPDEHIKIISAQTDIGVYSLQKQKPEHDMLFAKTVPVGGASSILEMGSEFRDAFEKMQKEMIDMNCMIIQHTITPIPGLLAVLITIHGRKII